MGKISGWIKKQSKNLKNTYQGQNDIETDTGRLNINQQQQQQQLQQRQYSNSGGSNVNGNGSGAYDIMNSPRTVQSGGPDSSNVSAVMPNNYPNSSGGVSAANSRASGMMMQNNNVNMNNMNASINGGNTMQSNNIGDNVNSSSDVDPTMAYTANDNHHNQASSVESSVSNSTDGTSLSDSDESSHTDTKRSKKSKSSKHSQFPPNAVEYSPSVGTNSRRINSARNGGAGNGNGVVDSAAGGHLNSLFNGHLMKWKFEAEEGTPFLRIPAFFAALGCLGCTGTALVFYPETWTVGNFVIAFFIFIEAIVICILDGRFLCSSPLSFRAHLRKGVTTNINLFRYLWGRSLLYMSAGILSCALLQLLTLIAGAVMCLVGLISFTVGSYASRKFSSLRSSLADESFLLLEFGYHDYDQDGYISATEFSNLLATLGMELDDRYNLKAFQAIDSDNDRKISFEEFAEWWNLGYIERGRRNHQSSSRHHDGGDNSSGESLGESYRRLE